LAKATDIARQYVTRFGMGDSTGQAVLEQVLQPYLDTAITPTRRDYAEDTAREVDLAVRDLIAQTFERAKAILGERRPDLEAGAQLLLDKETITPADFPAIGGRPPAGETAGGGSQPLEV